MKKTLHIQPNDNVIVALEPLYAGETVAAGQTVALTGALNENGEPHMEFRVTWNGDYIDPEDVLEIKG